MCWCVVVCVVLLFCLLDWFVALLCCCVVGVLCCCLGGLLCCWFVVMIACALVCVFV